jgi:hypothetical protein
MYTEIPESFEDSRYCIEQERHIPLTRAFIRQRLTTLREPNNEETKRFIKCYGKTYWHQGIAWFGRALTFATQSSSR